MSQHNWEIDGNQSGWHHSCYVCTRCNEVCFLEEYCSDEEPDHEPFPETECVLDEESSS